MNDERGDQTPPDAAAGAPPRSDAGDGPAGGASGAPQGEGQEKPRILQETQFTVEEGWLYKAFRTGAIWMNKLFFSAIVLWVVWLGVGSALGDQACAPSLQVTETQNGTGDEAVEHCSVWLSATSLYLGAMAILSFILSTVFGMLGLVVGKNIFESTPTEEEVGAGSGSDGERDTRDSADDASSAGDRDRDTDDGP